MLPYIVYTAVVQMESCCQWPSKSRELLVEKSLTNATLIDQLLWNSDPNHRPLMTLSKAKQKVDIWSHHHYSAPYTAFSLPLGTIVKYMISSSNTDTNGINSILCFALMVKDGFQICTPNTANNRKSGISNKRICFNTHFHILLIIFHSACMFHQTDVKTKSASFLLKDSSCSS